jgi:hypothetical protein
MCMDLPDKEIKKAPSVRKVRGCAFCTEYFCSVSGEYSVASRDMQQSPRIILLG